MTDAPKDAYGALSKTYRETAEQFIGDLKAKTENPELMPDDTLMFQFAEYLDSFPSLNPQMELLATQAARKIDREFIEELIDACGLEKATELARKVNMRHIRGYTGTPQIRPEEEYDALKTHEEIDAVIEGDAPTHEEQAPEVSAADESASSAGGEDTA